MMKRHFSFSPTCKRKPGEEAQQSGNDRTLSLEDLSGLCVEDGLRGAPRKPEEHSGGCPGCEVSVGGAKRGAEEMQGRVWIPAVWKGELDMTCRWVGQGKRAGAELGRR